MQLQFHYRWLYAIAISVMMLVLACLFDVEPNLASTTQLKIEKDDLQQQLLQFQIMLREKNNSHQPFLLSASPNAWDESQFFSALFLLAQQHAVTITTVNSGTVQLISQMPFVEIKLIIEGDYTAMAAFLEAFKQSVYPIFIDNFALSNKANSLSLMIHLKILQDKWLVSSPSTSEFSFQHDPFCSSVWPTNTEKIKIANQINTSILRQSKLVGYLQQGHKQAALLLLPNNMLMSIQPGSVLDKNRVLAMNTNQVIFQLADKTRLSLKLRI